MQTFPKKLFLFFSLAAFLTAVVFGFLIMHGGEGHETGCIFASTQSADCPTTGGFWGHILRHIQAMHSIVVFAAGSASVASFLFLFAALLAIAIAGFSLPVASVAFAHTREKQKPLIPQSFSHWLALHEKRDPHSVFLKTP